MLYIRVTVATSTVFYRLVDILGRLGMPYTTVSPTVYCTHSYGSWLSAAIIRASGCGSILITTGSYSDFIKFFSTARDFIITGSLDFIGASYGSSFFGKVFEVLIFDEKLTDVFFARSFIFSYYFVIKGFFFLMFPYIIAFCVIFAVFNVF